MLYEDKFTVKQNVTRGATSPAGREGRRIAVFEQKSLSSPSSSNIERDPGSTMELDRILSEEKRKLAAEREARKIREQDEYDNHPRTKMQNEMRALVPQLDPIVRQFSSTIDAICEGFISNDVRPNIVAGCYLWSKRKSWFRTKKDKCVMYIHFGTREHSLRSHDGGYSYYPASRLEIFAYGIPPRYLGYRSIYTDLPLNQDLKEWFARELAKHWAQRQLAEMQ